jgi:hypothetical protein
MCLRAPAAHHPGEHLGRVGQGALTGSRGRETFPGTAALAGLRLRDREANERLLFQPIERGIDGADRDVAPRPPLDLLPDADAVRVAPSWASASIT